MANWIYYNRNQDGEHISDCVTRAISTATGLSYPQIRKKLHHTSRLFSCDKLTRDCYSNLLDRVFQFQRVNGKGMNVGEFADIHPYGTFIVRVPNHATTIINGNIYDIFDCRDYPCDIVWQVENTTEFVAR